MTTGDGVSPGARGVRPGVSWSGTVDYGPGPLHSPTGLEELRALVARSRRIRALGTRHSFSRVAASEHDLVTLERMPASIDIDTTARTARVGAGVRYGALATAAWERGLSLGSMGSLPHISVAGASATGTHGSGDRNRVLAASVRGIEMVTATGDLVTLSREQDPEVFDGAVLALGSLGVITHLVIDLVPAFHVSQTVHLDLPKEGMTQENLSAALAGARSVSLFHHWDGTIAQAWVKHEHPATPGIDEAAPPPDSWFGARRAPGPVHPLIDMPAGYCTDQSGVPGPAHDRLPHFRMEFTPSSGEEIQSEYFVGRADLAAALDSVMPLGERIREVLQVSEVRTVAADQLWLSPAHQRDSACLHFTWKRRPQEVLALLPEIEAALAPFEPRPHWGKVFTLDAETVRAQYPRLADLQALRDRLDPHRTFANAYVDGLLGA